MNPIDKLTTEFEREMKITRKHLERLPEEKLEWRPHEKSFSAVGLASHITESVGWAETIFKHDSFDFDPATYKPYRAASVSELWQTFDDNVARGKQALATMTEPGLDQNWAFTIMGKPQFEKPRADVFRDFVLSHVIHHRGQFSVYLRLLNVAVPGSYGPSGDEQ